MLFRLRCPDGQTNNYSSEWRKEEELNPMREHHILSRYGQPAGLIHFPCRAHHSVVQDELFAQSP